MFLRRLVLAIGALFCMGSALLGVEFSGATWTDTSQTPVAVSAAYDWTPPTVTVSDPGSSVKGSSVTIQAVASDSRSTVASVTIEFSRTGSSWTPLTACSSSGTSTVTYTCTWDTTTGVPDGSYQLRATATDAAGNSGMSPLVSTAVTNNVGVVLTRLPAYVRGTVPVRGDLNNAVTPGAQLTLEYSPSGGAWSQLNGSCSSTGTPIQCSWNTNTPTVPDGTYDLRVRASTGQSDVQAGVIVDNTAPTANVSVPAGPLSGTVSMAGSGGDGTSGVGSVLIQYGQNGSWVTCGTGTSSPYSCNLDTTKLADGNYDFQVVVTDRAGNSTTNGPVTRTIVNSVPTVSITAPTAGANLDGTVTISGSGQSTNGTQSLKLEYQPAAGGNWTTACTPTVSGTSYTYSCAWNTTGVTNGSYNLRATLTPTSGNAVTSTVAVNVQHPTGSVSITTPVAGATVSSTVTVTGTASASVGVQKVQVTVAPVSPTTGTTSTLTCTLGSGTFSCPWNTVGLNFGTWRLTAQMTPVSGAVVTSTPVDVTVHNASIALGAVPVNLKGTSTTLTATASSNAGITAVRFEVTTATGTTTTPCPTNAPTQVNGSTYTCTWNISPITYGVYSVRAVMVQGSGLPEMASSSATTTVDNRTLGGYDVWTVNGGIANLPDGGDQIFFRYTGLVKLSTIDAGLTYGGSVPLSVSLTGDPGSHPDTMTFSNPNLGGLTLTQRYLQNNKSVTYGGSTLTAILAKDAQGNDVTVIKVTLSQISTTDFTAPTSAANTLIWTPPASVTDALGNPCLTTATPELGTADPDF